MILEDEQIDGLSADPEEAFIQVVRIARRNADAGIFSEEGSTASNVVTYVATVRAAATAYDIEQLQTLYMPDPSEANILNQYHAITAQVDEFVLGLQLVRRRNAPQYSVSLDSTAKAKIHVFINRIREEIEKADLDADKRNELFKKLHALAMEVDLNRTSFQRFMADLVVVAPFVERGATAIAKILGVMNAAKEDEERVLKSFPRAATTLKIAGPPPTSKAVVSKSFSQDLDDEIPF